MDQKLKPTLPIIGSMSEATSFLESSLSSSLSWLSSLLLPLQSSSCRRRHCRRRRCRSYCSCHHCHCCRHCHCRRHRGCHRRRCYRRNGCHRRRCYRRNGCHRRRRRRCRRRCSCLADTPSFFSVISEK